jgi:hypothetical protein
MTSLVKGALLGAAMVMAFASMAQAETFDVDVPFAFLVGSTEMPAGHYRIERDAADASSVLLFRGEHGSVRLFVQTTPLVGSNPAGAQPVLVFVPDENAKRLTQIWSTGTRGQELPVTRGKTRPVAQS